MANASATGYFERLQKDADEYFAETGKETATAKEIAVWAIQTGRWEAPNNLVLRKCREDFAKALREQCLQDDFARPVRAKHVARIVKGEHVDYLWSDIRIAPKSHMELAFRQRRLQIVGDCRQLKRDMDYYNTAHPTGKPIQTSFDFTDDVEDGKFSGTYPPAQPR